MNPKRNESRCGQGIFEALSSFAPPPTKVTPNECRPEHTSSEKNMINSNLLDHQNLPQEMEPPIGGTKLDRLKAKCHQCESLGALDSFKKHIENDLENTISMLEAENIELKHRLDEFELMSVNLLAENESKGKKIECLISEKIALEVSVEKMKSLDEYAKVLEEERSMFVEIERERDHLQVQVLKEKEKSKDLAGLQQFVMELTKEYDTLNSQLEKQQI